MRTLLLGVLGALCVCATLTILIELRKIQEQLKAMADQTQELQDAINELVTSVQNEKQEVQASISELNQKISDLQAAIDQGQNLAPFIQEVKDASNEVKGIVDRPVPVPVELKRASRKS